MKPTEKHIEKYIKYPSKLSHNERAWIQKWIDEDEEFGLLAQWYKEYYETLHQIEKNKKRSKERPSVVDLKPYKNRSKKTNGFVLAAQTSISKSRKGKLKTVKTFISETHKTLLRILHDEGNRFSKLYVISEYVGRDDIVLIQVKDEDVFFVSEKGGTFTIPDGKKFSKEKISDWKQCKLHLPVAKIRVFFDQENQTMNVDSSETDKETQDFNFKILKDKLYITLDFKPNTYPEKLVYSSGERSAFLGIEDGKCSIPLEVFKDSESCFYFFK